MQADAAATSPTAEMILKAYIKPWTHKIDTK